MARKTRQFAPTNVYAAVCAILVSQNAHSVTKILAPNHVVRATRKLYQGRISARERSAEILISDGPPNYATREFIKQCQKASMRFPIDRYRIEMPPEPRARVRKSKKN